MELHMFKFNKVSVTSILNEKQKSKLDALHSSNEFFEKIDNQNTKFHLTVKNKPH